MGERNVPQEEGGEHLVVLQDVLHLHTTAWQREENIRGRRDPEEEEVERPGGRGGGRETRRKRGRETRRRNVRRKREPEEDHEEVQRPKGGRGG